MKSKKGEVVELNSHRSGSTPKNGRVTTPLRKKRLFEEAIRNQRDLLDTDQVAGEICLVPHPPSTSVKSRTPLPIIASEGREAPCPSQLELLRLSFETRAMVMKHAEK